MGNICHKHFGRIYFTKHELLFLAKQSITSDSETLLQYEENYEPKPPEAECDLQHHGIHDKRVCKPDAQEMKTDMTKKREGKLTLTPSGFLFSRLLAAVEKKKVHGNQWTAGIAKCTHACTRIYYQPKSGPAGNKSRREKCKSSQEIK